MKRLIHTDNDPIYKGILPPLWNGRQVITCDLCAQVQAGVGPSSDILFRRRIPIVVLALNAITWTGHCPKCGQQFYADLSHWPRGRACD